MDGTMNNNGQSLSPTLKGFVVKHESGRAYPRSFSDSEKLAIDAFLRHLADLAHEPYSSKDCDVKWKRYLVQGYSVVRAEIFIG